MLLYTPTKVHSERNCIKNHAQELAFYGTKAMLVTGRSSARKSGALKDVIDVLESQNLSYVVFEEIEENPSIETVMRARQIGLDEKVDFVIGIGGGSPLDAAKIISLGTV